MSFIADPLVHRVIGCAIAVHRALGPGLLESTYLRCLCAELRAAGIPFESEVTVPLVYRDINIERAYRIDLLVDRRLVVEVKSCATVLPIHKAQVRTYVRLCRGAQGLILNFNEGRMTDGVKR